MVNDDKVKLCEGYALGMTEVGPYISGDSSGHAFFISNEKGVSLREKMFFKLFTQLHKELTERKVNEAAESVDKATAK